MHTYSNAVIAIRHPYMELRIVVGTYAGWIWHAPLYQKDTKPATVSSKDCDVADAADLRCPDCALDHLDEDVACSDKVPGLLLCTCGWHGFPNDLRNWDALEWGQAGGVR